MSLHHAHWGSGPDRAVAPEDLRPGDTLDRDGTHWHIADVHHLRNGDVDLLVRRVSCNGLPGTFRLHLSRDVPLVGTLAPPGRRHVRDARSAHVHSHDSLILP